MSKDTYGVCVLRKYKRGAVGGIETHVERRATISHTNPEIDRTKSNKNYDLNGRFNETFKSILKSRVKQTGAKGYERKNGVVVCELLFSASPDFFKNMNYCFCKLSPFVFYWLLIGKKKRAPAKEGSA